MLTEEEIQKRAKILLGNYYFKLSKKDMNLLHDAFNEYKEAEAYDELKNLGAWFLKQGFVSWAIEAFKFVGEFPSQDFIDCGERYKKKGGGHELYQALQAFQAVGANQELISLAELCFEKNEMLTGVKCYKAAGAIIPPKKLTKKKIRMLLAEGRKCEKDRSVKEAVLCYETSNTTDRIAAAAEKCLKKSDLNTALLYYKAAKMEPPKDKLAACAEKLLKKGELEEGLKAYALADIEPPQNLLVVCGNKCLNNARYKIGSQFSSAAKAFQLAGIELTQKQLIAAGDKYLKQGRINDAIDAYKTGGAVKKLTRLGNQFIDKNIKRCDSFYKDHAIDAFKAATEAAATLETIKQNP